MAAKVTASASGPAIPDAATLSGQLLDVGDLPAGWSTTSASSGSTPSIVGCDIPSFKQNETARAEADFQANTAGIPAVSETLASFSGNLSQAGFTSGADTLNACKSFSLSTDGTTFQGTAHGISLGANFADQSAAWQLAISAADVHIVIDEVAVRIGDEDMLFSDTDSTVPVLATLDGLVTTAVDKVTGATPPVTTTVPATATVTPTSSAPAINYAQQFQTDVAPWNADVTRAGGTGLTSPQTRASGQEATTFAQQLISQTWPAVDENDIHALASALELIAVDIQADNLTKFDTDATTVAAATKVVRTDLGL